MPPAIDESEPRSAGRGRRPAWLERRGLLAILGVLLAGWLVVVFAGALGEANETGRLAEQLRAENAELQRLVDAGRTEIELIKTDLFLRLQARAYGLGDAGERPFALADGAPSPPPLRLLGGDAAAARALTPLDAWLELLFGA